VYSRFKFAAALFPLLGALASCGGGGDEPFQVDDVGQADFPGATAPPGVGVGGSYQGGVFLPASNFDDMCVTPRSGTSDVPGTVTDQNNWLRSWTNDTYLWYSEVTYPNPASYSTETYFDLLKTNATTASGQAKDQFHFTYDTDTWQALSQGGESIGYGAAFEILESAPPRRIVVAFVEEDTPAEGFLRRGDEILMVDGVDAVNGSTQAAVDVLNASLFPEDAGAPHTFVVRDPTGAERTVNLVAEVVEFSSVLDWSYIDTATGRVGYIVFNDHNAPAERDLVGAIEYMRLVDVDDLIIDMRYNGGGYLDIAAQLAYMVANTTLTAGQTFERMVFNSKHPSVNPVTGETIVPTPFHSTTLGFSDIPPGTQLPRLNLNRVYIITGSGTCSASEAVINGLRGVGVQVYIIGSTTCGKPYGFYPTDNCGTTYFSIQFRGENAAGFGEYTDGFSPINISANPGVVLPGCSVADDFTHELFDQSEGRLAATLAFRASNNTTCPAATGYTDPRLSKASFQNSNDRHLWVSKPAARMNRILRKP
jgi:carboxyl-terminal processing protease